MKQSCSPNGTKSSVVVGYFIAAINILFLSSLRVTAGRLTTGRRRKKRANYRSGPRLRAARREVSIVVKRFVSPASCRFSSRSRHWQFEQRRSVDDGRGVPIRISYSNVDSIHGSIMGYEGEWRDRIYTRGYLRRDSNREEGFHTRAHTRATIEVLWRDSAMFELSNRIPAPVRAKTETRVDAHHSLFPPSNFPFTSLLNPLLTIGSRRVVRTGCRVYRYIGNLMLLEWVWDYGRLKGMICVVLCSYGELFRKGWNILFGTKIRGWDISFDIFGYLILNQNLFLLKGR